MLVKDEKWQKDHTALVKYLLATVAVKEPKLITQRGKDIIFSLNEAIVNAVELASRRMNNA